MNSFVNTDTILNPNYDRTTFLNILRSISPEERQTNILRASIPTKDHNSPVIFSSIFGCAKTFLSTLLVYYDYVYFVEEGNVKNSDEKEFKELIKDNYFPYFWELNLVNDDYQEQYNAIAENGRGVICLEESTESVPMRLTIMDGGVEVDIPVYLRDA